ncbi:uncharacterized protein SEPMUDRAFT_147471 [Sphaerulina musiva SO2202]|uniref:Uncharacterized protein n=1 Tax=Sphaerulina musiva (strain SO2202) TaxID=692275 RepID=M3C5U1_SPHMS|nr:uncharacterized protein SEPMUDRAFT_147471 [Sphaerulina musiva SO2202]EMF15646.1 hypothetical protein SEPMUDRAFT_147471 [Sphaerulina musiva SO2202]
MLFMSAISSLALLVSTVAAYPLAQAEAVVTENPNLEITSLVVNDTTTGNTLLTFNVTNPEPLANQAVANCTGSWSHEAKDWPSSAQSLRCDNSDTMTWYIDSWTSARDFVIAVQDRYTDPDIGEAPYDRVTVFTKATINATYVAYSSNDLAADPISGSQIANTTIYAPIYAIAAK